MITGWLVVGYRVVTKYFGVATGWLRVVTVWLWDGYGVVTG